MDGWKDFNKPPVFLSSLKTCKLLVIDDFGTGDIPENFMTFFMDLINTRTQWTDRGTIITTNLDNKTLGIKCGEALANRLTTGQQFKFEGASRRNKVIL